MAKGKKIEKVVTSEEKLKRALVSIEEQPYPVPENWCWVKFGKLIKLISGRDANLADCNDKGIGIPYILGASNINNNTFSAERWIKNPQVVSNKGDILLSVKGTIGKLYLQQESEINISRQIMAIRPLEGLSTEITYWFLISICEELRAVGNGLIPGISRIDILNKPYPLAPMQEQQRIVERIESLFAKLDEAKEKVQAVVDSFETRKAAILHKAFAGELTAKWRHEKGMGLDSWKTTTINDLFEVFSGKGFKEKEYSIGGIKLLRISNVTYNSLVWEDTKYLPASYLLQESALVLQPEDIVIALNRPITNNKLKISIIDDLEQYILYQRVGCLRKKNQNNSTKYLLYTLLSQNFLHQVENNLQGSDQPYINLPQLKMLSVTICSREEQKEIARILDKLFDKEQHSKEAAESVLEQIEIMKKSILARAFRGELGTNNPDEDSSLELIKQTLSETIVNGSILELNKTERIGVKFVPKTIMEVLDSGVHLTPETLKSKTGLQIDDFYEQLKELIDNGQIIETRMDGESYLEAVHAD